MVGSRFTGIGTNSCKIRKLLVMPLLDPLDHYSDLDPWPWGGEPIYRYCDQQLYAKEAVCDAFAGSSGPSL